MTLVSGAHDSFRALSHAVIMIQIFMIGLSSPASQTDVSVQRRNHRSREETMVGQSSGAMKLVILLVALISSVFGMEAEVLGDGGMRDLHRHRVRRATRRPTVKPVAVGVARHHKRRMYVKGYKSSKSKSKSSKSIKGGPTQLPSQAPFIDVGDVGGCCRDGRD